MASHARGLPLPRHGFVRACAYALVCAATSAIAAGTRGGAPRGSGSASGSARYADWLNFTVFHTNQLNYSAGDIADMNTADTLGDLEFTIRAKIIPLECADPAYATHASYDCSNPEQDATNLGVTKLIVQVDPAKVGTYCPCNVHFGVYSCDNHGQGKCDGFGAVSVFEFLAKYQNVSRLNASTPDFIWYGANTLQRYRKGMWYSTVGSARCKEGSSAPCSWRVHKVVKRVARQCSDKLQERAVRQHSAGCFDKCPQPTNSSSACWTRCYFDTMLGPHAGSKVSKPTDGMATAAVIAAWNAAFDSSAPGKGCPSV